MRTFETYKEISDYEARNLTQDNPSCSNDKVSAIRYRVTVDKIEEPKEVYKNRLQKLWDECSNSHHWGPLQRKAKELGVELVGSPGSKRKDR